MGVGVGRVVGSSAVVVSGAGEVGVTQGGSTILGPMERGGKSHKSNKLQIIILVQWLTYVIIIIHA